MKNHFNVRMDLSNIEVNTLKLQIMNGTFFIWFKALIKQSQANTQLSPKVSLIVDSLSTKVNILF